MTKLLYQTDAYLKEFTATVTAVDDQNHGVVFDQTAFYPGGGGQPADKGTLAAGNRSYVLKRVKRINGQLVHLLDGDDPLPAVDSLVNGVVDWELRYQLMRTHTAMHILCGVFISKAGSSSTARSSKASAPVATHRLPAGQAAYAMARSFQMGLPMSISE